MRKVRSAVFPMGLLAMAVVVATSAHANPSRVTQGDAQAILRAFPSGGWAVILNGGTMEEGAPTDFREDSMARISPMGAWNGRHFCSLDWHVISVAAIEGNPLGGTRTNSEIRENLSQIGFALTLDGARLETIRTAIARTLNPELRGFVEAFYVLEGQVMAPEDLSVGQHSLQFTGTRPGRPPMVMPPITFFIDSAGQGTCL